VTDTATAATAAQVVVSALRESARRNKRLSAQHRRAAQQDMAALEEIRNKCRAIGIEVVIEPEA
jgi:aspartate aminotransferase-like enzyme